MDLYGSPVDRAPGDWYEAFRMLPNGHLTQMLQNLIDCDLVHFMRIKHKKLSSRGGLYQLTDLYSIFHLQFINDRTSDTRFWSKNIDTPTINAWLGLSFERICLKHIEQIMKALHIDTISTEHYSWRGKGEGGRINALIDIVIERGDRMANVCEVKYNKLPYVMKKEEFMKCLNRNEEFRLQTGFNGGIIPTLVTTYPVKRNEYSEHFMAQVTLDDLFEG